VDGTLDSINDVDFFALRRESMGASDVAGMLPQEY
jgi:hypothetical protein